MRPLAASHTHPLCTLAGTNAPRDPNQPQSPGSNVVADSSPQTGSAKPSPDAAQPAATTMHPLPQSSTHDPPPYRIKSPPRPLSKATVTKVSPGAKAQTQGLNLVSNPATAAAQGPQPGLGSPPQGPQSPHRDVQSPARSHASPQRGSHRVPGSTSISTQPPQSPPQPSASKLASERRSLQLENAAAATKVSSPTQEKAQAQPTKEQAQTQAAPDRQTPLKRKRLVRAFDLVKKRATEVPAALPASTEVKPSVKSASVGGLALVPLPQPKLHEKALTNEELRLLDDDAPYWQEPLQSNTLSGHLSAASSGHLKSGPALSSAAKYLRAGQFAPNEPRASANTPRHPFGTPGHVANPDSRPSHAAAAGTDPRVQLQSGNPMPASSLLALPSKSHQDLGFRAEPALAAGRSLRSEPVSQQQQQQHWWGMQQHPRGDAQCPQTTGRHRQAADRSPALPGHHPSQHAAAKDSHLPDAVGFQLPLMAPGLPVSPFQRLQDNPHSLPKGLVTQPNEGTQLNESTQQDTLSLPPPEQLSLQSRGSFTGPRVGPNKPPQDPRRQLTTAHPALQGSSQQNTEAIPEQPAHNDQDTHQHQSWHEQSQPKQHADAVQGHLLDQPQHQQGSSRQRSLHPQGTFVQQPRHSVSQASQAGSESSTQAVLFGMKRSLPVSAEPVKIRTRLSYCWGKGSHVCGYLDLQAFCWSTDTVGKAWHAAGKPSLTRIWLKIYKTIGFLALGNFQIFVPCVCGIDHCSPGTTCCSTLLYCLFPICRQ